MKIFAIYLVFFKGYSVIRFSDIGRERNEMEYGACNRPMEFDYGHDGDWGMGVNPFEAVINCYKKANYRKKAAKRHFMLSKYYL